ncbi:GlxA family transcriptional regulator [Stenotrophomonas maltophilia]|uniref:Helix-turn-helix domain-containing protein n=1 Tax=Stenotrophomonas maltophilia TaxID=40324 RepID=A0A4S2CVD9_STEMA|nr:helix-turn-helix domain-containing protein [Stenotrophomonas maltophilia]TGY31614.1 helix-turn-helix domain-containing protein [Stenotrophomonas maltophilia]
MQDFTVIVLPGAFASSVALTVDMLSTAATLAPRLGVPAPRWQICSATRGPVRLGEHLQLRAHPLPRAPDGNACWIVPGLGVDDPQAIAARLAGADVPRVLRALRAHAAAGGRLAASCASVFLLQAAGLLAQRRVTTTWWLAAALQRLEPACQVDADHMVIDDGPVTTAGAALGHSDLMLHLLRQRFGPALAGAVARALLLDRRQLQSPFMVPAMMAQGNALIAALTAHVEAHLPTAVTVGDLAHHMGMSTRTLSRQVTRATGHGPLHLIRSVQLNRARALLQNSRYSVEAVAEQVGYGDPTALRRLLRQRLNATPRQLR